MSEFNVIDFAIIEFYARNVNRWKGSVEARPFIGLLILDVINRLVFLFFFFME